MPDLASRSSPNPVSIRDPVEPYRNDPVDPSYEYEYSSTVGLPKDRAVSSPVIGGVIYKDDVQYTAAEWAATYMDEERYTTFVI